MVYRTVPKDCLLDLLLSMLDLLRHGLLVVRVSQDFDFDLDDGWRVNMGGKETCSSAAVKSTHILSRSSSPFDHRMRPLLPLAKHLVAIGRELPCGRATLGGCVASALVCRAEDAHDECAG